MQVNQYCMIYDVLPCDVVMMDDGGYGSSTETVM